MSFSEPERFGFVRWVSVSVSVWLLVVNLCRFGECGLLLCRCDAKATRALADCGLALPRGNQFAERVREELARRVHAQPVLDGARLLRARLCALLLHLSLPFSLSAARFFFFSFSFAPSFPTARVREEAASLVETEEKRLDGDGEREEWLELLSSGTGSRMIPGSTTASNLVHRSSSSSISSTLGLGSFVSWLLRLAS